jgi:4-amino-4-deoxy-L-arabinose transferase-like glycosyltransferase
LGISAEAYGISTAARGVTGFSLNNAWGMILMKFATESRYVCVLLALCVLVNASGLFVTIIGPDGALYASIAKTMVQRANYMELFAEGRDWLDKPHFPFWITAFSFKLFGFTTWAYKLPALLFMLMGAAYTYAFARNLYNKEVALWSVIILLTAEHIIISNNDVRAEPYLTGLIIAGIYHFYQARVRKHAGHLLAGAIFAACAVMTKGLFALIPIGGAIAGELIIKKQWRELLHIRWLAASVLILIFISPELYCLYYQFDAHPEKVVFDRQGVSGIRFFFWDSQFGRFFNTGPIRGKGDPFFFVHTLLWAFLPWSILLYAAIFRKIKGGLRWGRFGRLHMGYGHSRGEQYNGIDKPLVITQEWYTISGALLCFLVFSASRFQLPHYMNIVFPLFAIITADYVLRLKKFAVIRVVQAVVCVVLLLLAVGVHFLFEPGRDWLAGVLVGFGLVGWLAYRPVLKGRGAAAILTQSALVIILVNLYLNLVFYPALLKYQSGSEAAFYANKHYPGVPVAQFGYSYALEFYLDAPLVTVDSSAVWAGRVLMYAPVKEMETSKLKLVREFDHFHVSRLTLKLLNSQTRAKEVERWGLWLAERE